MPNLDTPEFLRKRVEFGHLTHKPLLFHPEQSQRQETRILVAGGEVTRNRDWLTGKPFQINPVGIRTGAWEQQGGLVLYMHNHNIPLAKGAVYKEGGKLWSPDDLQFHREVVPVATQNWIGDAIGAVDTAVIANMWEQRFLNAVSIGIMFTDEDIGNIVETEEAVLFNTSEMLEYSIVTLAADRDAHRQGVSQKDQYEFMLSSGVDEEAARCLTCYTDTTFSISTMEVNSMPNKTVVEEEVVEEAVEEEVVEEAVETEEAELLINPDELIQFAMENENFMRSLAQAVVSNPIFSQSIQEMVANTQPSQSPILRLRFSRNGAVAEKAAEKPTQPKQVNGLYRNSSLRLMNGGK